MSETPLQCPECGESRPAFLKSWAGKVGCESCGCKFEKPQTDRQMKLKREKLLREEQEEKQNRLQRPEVVIDILEKLCVERERGGDYLEIDPELREEAERMFSAVLSKPLNDWKPSEARIFRILTDYPLRKEYFSLLRKEGDSLILSELKKITALTEIQLKAIAELGRQSQALTSQVGGVKVGTTVTGMLAAKELGDHLFED